MITFISTQRGIFRSRLYFSLTWLSFLQYLTNFLVKHPVCSLYFCVSLLNHSLFFATTSYWNSTLFSIVRNFFYFGNLWQVYFEIAVEWEIRLGCERVSYIPSLFTMSSHYKYIIMIFNLKLHILSNKNVFFELISFIFGFLWSSFLFGLFIFTFLGWIFWKVPFISWLIL